MPCNLPSRTRPIFVHICRALTCFGGFERLSSRRKLLDQQSLRSVWKPPEDGHTIQVVSGDVMQSDMTTTPKEPMSRDDAVLDLVQQLQLERDRIKSSADTCGARFHKTRGIAELPPKNGEVGSSISLELGPHGDAPTTCRMATLPSIMKVCSDWISLSLCI